MTPAGTEFLQRIKDLPAGKLALLATQLQERLQQAEQQRASSEAIAVVGVGCRFPGGVHDAESYWDLLINGIDAVGDVPPQRWDADELYDPDWNASAKMASKWGGFLTDIDRFDARLFGISPREAATMDPQQRLLLEVTWQALERAAIAPASLAGSPTGVFVGLSSTDYLHVLARRGLAAIDGYLASGSAPSVASGRIAYLLGSNGPALTVDTACSSSLVAVHQAVQALRVGTCDIALAGGVNVILSPITTIALSKSQMLAPDGRCKTFSARADGFVRGEGCGMLVLKRLSDAQAGGDRIVGVIRGSAINQDGRSNGLTAPNGPAQEAVLALALADAGVTASDVGFVEAHGTGTRLGDPIEVQALGAVLGRNRAQDAPLLIGSVKTNIGHLESAAGVAGLIKAMLVLEHGAVPPHLHLDQPSPVIPWSSLPIDVPVSTTEWPAGRPRIAGVSSFGFSGTNAHVLLEAPPAAPAAGGDRAVDVFAVSAQTEPALRALAGAVAQSVDVGRLTLSDTCAAFATGRDAFAHRVAITAAGPDELVTELHAVAAGRPTRRAAHGHVTATRPARPVWLFTGQGAQYAGMGQRLYETEPVFAAALDRCDAVLRSRFDVPLLDVMWSGDGRLDQTGYTQPALFSLEVALAELWRSWGVHPAAVLGHSVGELAAAHVAGVFDLDDGLTLVAGRGRLMQALPGGGRMVAIDAPVGVVEEAIEAVSAYVSIAAVNAAASTVISGPGEHVQRALDALDAQVGRHELAVSHAFHSPAMDPILDEFEQLAGSITLRPPNIPILSNLTAGVAGGELGAPEYWRRHVREAVRFGPSIATAVAQGHRLFLELGPHPTLIGIASRDHAATEIRWAHSLRRDRPDTDEIARGVATLWSAGAPIDWQAWHGDGPRSRPILPTYPMQRERHWPDGVGPWRVDDRIGAAPDLDGLLYEVAWRPAGGGVVQLGPVGDAARAVEARAGDVVGAHGVADYDRFLPRLDELCGAYVAVALRALTTTWSPGDRLTVDALIESGQVVAQHRRLLGRMFEILSEDGWLERDDASWIVRRAGVPDTAALYAAIRDEFPAFAAEADLVVRCGENLAGVLGGRTDPLEVLFPGGSVSQMEAIYTAMPMARAFNALVAEAIAATSAGAVPGRRLRVLEIGGGSGGTTDSALSALAGHPVEYVFTDVSTAFIAKARARFADVAGMTFTTFDATRDPLEQGFDPHSFDIVLAANVIHATPDLTVTLGHVHRLLAPGGRLVMLEATTRERFSDLTVGMTPGWWSFTDTDRRPDYALLSHDAWIRALADTGFADAVAVPAVAATPELRREAVVVAAMPAAPLDVGAAGAARWHVAGTGALAAAVAGGLAGRGIVVDADAPTAVAIVLDGASGTRIEPAIEPASEPAVGPGAERDGHRVAVDALLGEIRAALGHRSPPEVAIVTVGAQPGADRSVAHPRGAVAWGVGHALALEHPELRLRLIDIEPGASDPGALAADELLTATRREPSVSRRATGRFVRRLVAHEPAPATQPVLDADGVHIVSGGLRGIGLIAAGWLVDHGARRLVLFGRRPPEPGAAATIEAWREQGVIVEVVLADAGSDADIARVVAAARALGTVRGVLHNAGALADASILNLNWNGFDTVFGPKVFGTSSLLRHLDTADLQFMVLFGSGSGVAGSAGQANHAAANAYLDALAHQLRARGLPVATIDWGAWQGVGAAAERGIDQRPGAFTADQGVAALGYVVSRLIGGDAPAQLLVHGRDWSDLAGYYAPGTEPPLYTEITGSTTTVAATSPVAARARGELRDEILGLPERRRQPVLRRQIRKLAADVLDIADPEQVELQVPLHDLGLDSLMAVELRNLLGTALDADLPATLLFEQPSVDALVEHLLTGHLTGTGPVPPPAVPVDTDGLHGPAGETPRPTDPAPADATPSLENAADALAARLARLQGRSR